MSSNVNASQCLTRDDPAILLLLMLAAHDLDLDYERMAELSHRLPDTHQWSTPHEVNKSMYRISRLAQELRQLAFPNDIHGQSSSSAPDTGNQRDGYHQREFLGPPVNGCEGRGPSVSNKEQNESQVPIDPTNVQHPGNNHSKRGNKRASRSKNWKSRNKSDQSNSTPSTIIITTISTADTADASTPNTSIAAPTTTSTNKRNRRPRRRARKNSSPLPPAPPWPFHRSFTDNTASIGSIGGGVWVVEDEDALPLTYHPDIIDDGTW